MDCDYQITDYDFQNMGWLYSSMDDSYDSEPFALSLLIMPDLMNNARINDWIPSEYGLKLPKECKASNNQSVC